ncbi:MAG: glycosyltransferase [Deltaproteobacteria bacterium]|nr:glycosyltransferase [Deltaproteobacteria bacterium]
MEKEFLDEYEKRTRNILVSVSCLTYNHEKFIEEALDSFLAQKTDFGFEIIVHDDASTDRTPDIIREYTARHPDIIRPIFQTENQFSKTGVYPSAAFTFSQARGRYIAECDGDDYWTDPGKLQKQADFLEANPDFSMCFHTYKILMENGLMVEPSLAQPHDYSPDELVAYQINGYDIHTSTKMFRNLYPTHRQDMLDFCGDYALTVLMGLHGKAKHLPDIAPSIYRKHPGNSWSGKPQAFINAKMKALHQRLYELIKQKGNDRHIALRRKFL